MQKAAALADVLARPHDSPLARCVVLTLPGNHGSQNASARRGGKPRLSQLLLVHRADGTACVAALRGVRPVEGSALDDVIAATAGLDGERIVHGARLTLADQRTIDECIRRAAGVAEAIRTFEADLDASLIEASPRRAPARYVIYAWLVRQPAIEAARIAQAAIAYPFLWALLRSTDRGATSALLARVRSAEPVSEAIGAMLSARPWQVRVLRDAAVAGHLTEDDVADASDLVALVRGLDALPPEHAPRTRAGWQYLQRLVASLPHKAWIRDLSNVGLDTLALGRGLPRTWRGFARLTGLRRQLSDIRDFYAYAADYSDQQWLPRDHDRSLRRVIEAQARWKSVVDPQGAQGAANDVDMAPLPAHLSGHWTPLVEGPVALDDVVFHELASENALREEGFLMKHCIATYARICEEKGSRIFSVRTVAGERVSTLQVLRIKGAWRVLQHRGKANGPVPAHCRRSAEAFVQTLPAG